MNPAQWNRSGQRKGIGMFAEDRLKLQEVRLRGSEQWTQASAGLIVVLVIQGTGQYVDVGTTQSINGGDVFAVNGMTGSIEHTDRREIRFQWFSVGIEQLFPLFAGKEVCFVHRIADNLKKPRLYSAQTEVAWKCQQLGAELPHEMNLEHRTQLLKIIGCIFDVELHADPVIRTQQARIQQNLPRVFEKVSAEDIVGLSIGELARKIGCSRRHLNRLFQEYLGLSAAALKMELRLQKALCLLRDHEAKVITVAEQCGFNHLGLFYTCFKRRFGSTPTEWRQAEMPHASPKAGSPVLLSL